MKKNRYDALQIFQAIQRDIEEKKLMILATGLFFFIIVIVLFPLTLIYFFLFLGFSDLPLFDHSFIALTRQTKLFLVPYVILLIYYFGVMYYKDNKAHLTHTEHYQKAKRYFIMALGIALLPFIFSDHLFLTLFFFLFFILTIYHLSVTYYDLSSLSSPLPDSDLYQHDDLGIYGGLIDNPFSMQDDINRAKLFIQNSTVGFSFIIFFMEMMIKSVIFLYAIGSKRYLQESTRLFDAILENDLEIDYNRFSTPSKVILELLGYLSFRDGKVILYKSGEEIETRSNQAKS